MAKGFFFRIRIWIFITTVCSFCWAQHANDTTCFTIKMNALPNSLFNCSQSGGEAFKSILSGPVIMENGTLLFYSYNGYALYNKNGALLDSNSLFRENKNIPISDPRRLKLAYPLDQSTVLYYKKNPDKNNELEIFEKKIMKKGMKRVEGVNYANLFDIESTVLFNLTDNCITDEMETRSFLLQNLVGFTSLDTGERIWSLDRFYAFTSALIAEHNGAVTSFFGGLLHDQKTDVQKHLINPLGTYVLDGRRYFYGIHSSLGSQDEELFQRLYLCDQAGNLLYSNEMLKQKMVDAVLEFNKKSNTNFTVKRPGVYVFTPTVDKNGDIFYGAIDFDKKIIEVKKRLYYRYFSRVIQPIHEDLVNAQRSLVPKPVDIPCLQDDKEKKVVPEFLFRDDAGRRRKAALKEYSCKGFYASVSRQTNPDIKRRLMQKCSTLPAQVRHLQDSLSRVSTAFCPYTVNLEMEGKGTLATFHYGLGDVVVSARVLDVTETFEILIRVDCENFAEVLAFSVDGTYLNRFVFNRQPFKIRKDIIAVSDNRDIIEEDYERIVEDYTYCKWELAIKAVEAQ